MNYLIDTINKNYSYLMDALTDLNSIYCTSSIPSAHKQSKYNNSSWMRSATEGFMAYMVDNYTQMGAKALSDMIIKPALNNSIAESMSWAGYKPNYDHGSYNNERYSSNCSNQFNPYNIFNSYLNTDHSPRTNAKRSEKSENLANSAIDMMASSAKQYLDSWASWYKNIT
jgi:hypothetical protein